MLVVVVAQAVVTVIDDVISHSQLQEAIEIENEIENEPWDPQMAIFPMVLVILVI